MIEHTGSEVDPCRCNPAVGCAHLMSWHVATSLEAAHCAVPGCVCIIEPCTHCENADVVDIATDAEVLAGLGISRG